MTTAESVKTTAEEKVFVIHAWEDTKRSGKKEVFELPCEASYPDTLKDFMESNPKFVSADIGMVCSDQEKPTFLGNHHEGKFTAYVY